MLLTNLLMLLLMGGIYLSYEFFSEKRALVHKVEMYSNMIGYSSTTALAFNEPIAAKEILSTLNRDKNVVQAAIFNIKEELLSAIPNAHDPILMLLSPHETYGFSSKYFESFDPILLDGELLGYIYIKYSTADVYKRVSLIALLTLGTILVLSLFIFWLTSYISTSISIPLLNLAQIAGLISEKKDYSLRVESDATGEIGTTIEAFNSMIKTIYTREKQLQLSNDKLEESKRLLEFRVEERTRELQERVLQHDRARKEARKLAAEAQIASQTKDAFLANMSHEMRTPLHGVLGMVSLLDRTHLDEKQRQFVDTVKKASHTLLTIINDILDLSKIESGKIDLEMLSFDLTNLIEEIIDMLYPKAEQKKIGLLKYIEADVPTHLIGDPTRLKQILMNLTNNALKFTKKGEVFIKCWAKSFFPEKEEVLLHFLVKDTGIGISDLQKKRLFKAFTQADNSTTRRFGGTGLGLVISKRLSEIMGGEMWVKSEKNIGSEFHFTLRMGIDKKPLHQEIDVPHHLFENKRVLVVDDNETNRYVLAMLLKRWQVDAVQIQSGKEAILFAKDHRVDAILLDYHMPDMDGLETAKELRKEHPKLPIILAVSASDTSILDQAKDLSIDNVLVKPTRENAIFDALLRVFQPDFIKKESVPPFIRNEEKTPKIEIHHRPLKILLAEDNPVNQFTANMMLEELGCKVQIVENGQLAVDEFKHNKYDLIFMDGHMPHMDGYQATKEIRKIEEENGSHHIFIVAMTANALSGERERCLATGMDEYMAKPYTLQDVQTLLVKFCQRYTSKEDSMIDPSSSSENPDKPSPEAKTVIVPSEYIRSLASRPEKVKELADLTASCLPSQLQTIVESLEKKDWETLERAAHTLKGSAASIGGEDLRAIAYEMEVAAKNFDEKACIEVMPKVSDKTEELLLVLKDMDWFTFLENL